MSNINMSNEDLAYSILEIKYIKAMGREVSIDPRTNKDLYPIRLVFYRKTQLKR